MFVVHRYFIIPVKAWQTQPYTAHITMQVLNLNKKQPRHSSESESWGWVSTQSPSKPSKSGSLSACQSWWCYCAGSLHGWLSLIKVLSWCEISMATLVVGRACKGGSKLQVTTTLLQLFRTSNVWVWHCFCFIWFVFRLWLLKLKSEAPQSLLKTHYIIYNCSDIHIKKIELNIMNNTVYTLQTLSASQPGKKKAPKWSGIPNSHQFWKGQKTSAFFSRNRCSNNNQIMLGHQQRSESVHQL